jgi:16S rRNA (cytosine967-C5)-methyltransferase
MESAMAQPAARYAHPEWLIEMLRQDWPGHWQAILEANNQRPPLHVRVNLRRLTRAQYLQQLRDAGRLSGAAEMVDTGVWLDQASAIEQIPGFPEGIVSIQDFAAQLAAPLLAAGTGERVLDACSAPGGKTLHLLEFTPEIATLIALDQSAERLDKLQANLRREGLHAMVMQGDARHPDQWWDGALFDKILLDAPCSATGVIRRHPDVKICRKPAQLPRFAATQRKLLQALWPLLGQGGRLLYSTCSLLRRENDAVIEEFINNHNDARSVPIEAPWGVPTAFGRQTLPGLENTDGFYYALLDRV